LHDERSKQAVLIAERYADGLVGQEQLRRAAAMARAAEDALFGAVKPRAAWAARAARLTAHANPWWVMQGTSNAVVRAIPGRDGARVAEEKARQAGLLRDVLGNPFSGVQIDPSWLRWNAGTVRKIAQSIYDAYRFGDLPVLADALEEAGCDNPDILAHCRWPGEHALGCWVVDALLGKE
jgi:hypothetical protein